MDEVRNEIEELSEIPFEEKVEHCGIKVWEVEGYGINFPSFSNIFTFSNGVQSSYAPDEIEGIGKNGLVTAGMSCYPPSPRPDMAMGLTPHS
ncbi:hypothetical protein Csa_002973 [Cucumis sativus]|uniref:Uncharacterized protein n=1 Tax=Cucumis sativus TaxID=3659 RepID=A0A0A0KKH9_CUCSA|nr:hypothetical protein Csa_002973 [Cucumis sativus]